jgi:hypothetical protein
MSATMIDLSSYEFIIAIRTFKFLESGKHFPKNVLPRQVFLPKEHDKFIDVPVFIALMLGY